MNYDGVAHILYERKRVLLAAYQDRFPASLLSRVRDDAYFAGGCIASLIRDEKPKDWDIFFKAKSTALDVRDFFQKNSEDVIIITDNSVTLKSGFQFITKFSGKPLIVVDYGFDFVHCLAYYEFFNDVLVCDGETAEVCKYGILKINPRYGSEVCPTRLQRFLNRGWRMDDGSLEQLKLLASVDLGNGKEYTECPWGPAGVS